MSRFSRVVVLVVGAMSVFSATASAAGAVTWTNTGDTQFTATTGQTRWNAGGVTLACDGGTATGMVGSSPFVGTIWTSAITGNMVFKPCRLGLLTGLSVDCSYTADLVNIVSGSATGTLSITCVVSLTTCTISGTVSAMYRNATSTTRGVLTIPAGASVTATGAGCPLPGPATMSLIVFTITTATGGPAPHNGPIFNKSP